MLIYSLNHEIEKKMKLDDIEIKINEVRDKLFDLCMELGIDLDGRFTVLDYDGEPLESVEVKI